MATTGVAAVAAALVETLVVKQQLRTAFAECHVEFETRIAIARLALVVAACTSVVAELNWCNSHSEGCKTVSVMLELASAVALPAAADCRHQAQRHC